VRTVEGLAVTAILSGHKEAPVTHLRKITLEEFERRNYSETTTRSYLHAIEDFARHFNRPPDQLGPEEIREFTAHMFRVRKLADNTVGQRVAALRFFFTRTLKRSGNIEERFRCEVLGVSDSGQYEAFGRESGLDRESEQRADEKRLAD
jgi:hypothetical protein